MAGWQFYRTATNLSYLAPVFRRIIRAAQNLNCNLLFGCGIGPSASPSDPYRPAWPVPSEEQDFVPIGPWNTHGLIVAAPLHSPARAEYLQQVRAAGFPVLFIGSGEPGPTIMTNNRRGIRQAVQHLVEHGRRQIAFVAGSVDDLSGDSGQTMKRQNSIWYKLLSVLLMFLSSCQFNQPFKFPAIAEVMILKGITNCCSLTPRRDMCMTSALPLSKDWTWGTGGCRHQGILP